MSSEPAALRLSAGPGSAPDQPCPDDAVLCFSGKRLLLGRAGAREAVPDWRSLAPRAGDVRRRIFVGHLDSRPIWALEVDEPFTDDGFAARSLRETFFLLADAEVQAAARAVQLLAWDRDHRYCGRCGAETEPRRFDHDRRCPRCAQSHYPRLAPAVIVLVHRGRDVLLARGPHLPGDMLSTLAGFVEPGESLEEAIHREIAEEVGVAVADLVYFGSQPWPFPHSLMVGFFARWVAGDIRLEAGPDGHMELERAAWFDIDDLPTIPPKISIARALIDAHRARLEAATNAAEGGAEG